MIDKRNELWIKQYDFEKNEEYILKLFKKFNIDKYHLTMNNGNTDVIISVGLNTYKIEINKYEMELVLYKEEKRRLGQRHPKSYLRPIKVFKDDIWYNVCKFISKDKLV